MIRKNSWPEKVNWHIGQRFGEKTDEDLCFYGGTGLQRGKRNKYTSSMTCNRNCTSSIVPAAVTYVAVLHEVAVAAWLHIPWYRWSHICPCFRGGNWGQGNLMTCQRSRLRSVTAQGVNLNSFSPRALSTMPHFWWLNHNIFFSAPHVWWCLILLLVYLKTFLQY